MENQENKWYSSILTGVKHPVTQYGARIAVPIAIYGTLGYLVARGLKSVAQNLDENIPRAFQQTQRLDELIGNALIERGGAPLKTAIKVDKGVKDLWGKAFGIDEAQRQRNRETLGLKEPSYLENKQEKTIEEVPVRIKTYTTQPSSQPAFHYFEKNANKISDPLIAIALGIGLLKGTYSAVKRGFRVKKQKRLIDKAVEKAIEARLKEEPKTYKFRGY